MDRRFLAAMALAASACSAPMRAAAPEAPSSPVPPVAAPPTVETPLPAAPTVEVARELRFTAPLLGGGRFRGQAYAGRDVALWFWAPW